MTLATVSNTALLFLDLQDEIIKNSRTQPADRVLKAAGVLAKLGALHGLPTFLSAVGVGGAFAEAVTGPLGGPEPFFRTQTSAFADPALVDALKASGRKVLVLAGVASEIVVQRTALHAVEAGYAVQIAVDACGGVDPRTEDAAWRRLTAAGAAATSSITLCADLAGDFTTPSGGATLGLMYEALGA
jgi:nicotinamidase-related amidase